MKRSIALLMTLALMMVSLGSVAAQSELSQDPVDPIDGCNYYEETGHNLCGVFLEYWEANGGLPVFGYPITEAFEEQNWDTGETYLVQYFERERMEHHTALAGTEYEILLGRLGNEVLLKQGRDWQDFEKSDPSEANYFAETGFAVPQVFLDYWMSHGLDFGDTGDKGEEEYSFRESLALFGYPISQAEMETNADGDTVLTQWFERARFEYHPDNDAEYQVLLGRLGVEILADDEPPPVERPVGAQAYTDLVNAEGVTVGTASFVETATGVQIDVQVSGLEPGTHGIHIHTVGVCEAPDFTSAGGHFNPYGAEHGFDNPNGPHAGDLPNLEVGEDGTGTLSFLNTLITLGEGEGSLFDEDGSALVIHAGMDDQHTDPAGDSGARIACGVITEGERPEEPAYELVVVAENLAAPLHASTGGDGAVYVAETGFPSETDECVVTGEDPETGEVFEACFGLNGSVTRVDDAGSEQVITGIPPISDVHVTAEGDMYAVTSLGGTPDLRDLFEDENVQSMGTLIQIHGDGDWTVIADLAQFEADVNPEPTMIDSNPYALTMDGENFLVVDAGGNNLLQVTPEGEITNLAIFDTRMVPAPPFIGAPEGTELPMESVPTDVEVGPDGNYYVVELTGFPFEVGAARVFQVTPAGAVSVYAEGFSAIGAIDFDSEGNLYVLEIATNGLLAAELDPTNPDATASRLVKVAPDGTQEDVVTEGIFAATGVAIDGDGHIFIVNGSLSPAPQVVRVDWVAEE